MDDEAVDGAVLSRGADTAPPARGPRGARGEIRRRITEAALRSFADLGLDGTSTRSIARDADCDPALVRYYFSSKEQLFAHVTQRPPAVDEQLDEMASLPHAERAAYLATLVEACWDHPTTSGFWRSLLRTAVTDVAVARRVEDTWSEFVALGVVQGLATVQQLATTDGSAGVDGVDGADGAAHDGAAHDGTSPDGAPHDVLPQAFADLRATGRQHSVVALSSITGMLAAVHVWSSRRAGALTPLERSEALAEVLDVCFTAPADR